MLADICHDLGIGSDHPLWQELQWVIIEHNGQIESVLKRTFQRIRDAYQEIREDWARCPASNMEPRYIPDTTGPPPLVQPA